MILWQKLIRLQRDVKKFSKPLTDIQPRLNVVVAYLNKAQSDLNDNTMDSSLRIKDLTDKVIELNEIEGKILQQKAMIQWLKMGDANNSYLYAHIKSRY